MPIPKNADGKGKSPYQKHRKTPFRYSELYYKWRAAITAGQTDEARRIGERHSKAHGMDPESVKRRVKAMNFVPAHLHNPHLFGHQ